MDKSSLSCQSISATHQLTRAGVVPWGPMAKRASSSVVAPARTSSLSLTEMTSQPWSPSTWPSTRSGPFSKACALSMLELWLAITLSKLNSTQNEFTVLLFAFNWFPFLPFIDFISHLHHSKPSRTACKLSEWGICRGREGAVNSDSGCPSSNFHSNSVT